MTTPLQRRILLTGASSGIGFQAALRLCRDGHALTLPCRDRATAVATLERLEQGVAAVAQTPNPTSYPRPVTPVCDLGDLTSVETLATELLRQGEPIDTLALNAGLQYTGASQPRRSAQGHELTIAVNHLAHQALTQQLLPLLTAGLAPRVVVTASEVHDPGAPGGRVGNPAGLENLDGLQGSEATGIAQGGERSAMLNGQTRFDAEKAYKDSKLCNILFARELERRLRLRGTPMPVLAWSPGLVIPRSRSGFFRYSRRHNEWGQRMFALVARDLLGVTASPEQAGALLAKLCFDPDFGQPDFSYRSNRLQGPGHLRFEVVEPSPEALDDHLAHRLWARSAQLMGLPPELTA